MISGIRAPFLLGLALVACGGRTPEAGSPEAREPVCRVLVEPSSTSGPAPAIPPSRAIAHVTLPFATMGRELEARVPKRLAEERDRDIGIAGSLHVTVDRGPLGLAAEGENLVVRAPVHARAEACAKGRCYASCEPEAIATVRVPLRLTPAFAFAPSRAEIAFTRGCAVRALGGFVRIDVTPMVESAARAQLRSVEQEIDTRLPKLRPQAERMWRELESPQKLPLACLHTNPSHLVQGPSSSTPDAVRLRFALVASPEVRPSCAAANAPRPLPPLAFDPVLPAEDDLELAMATPFATTSLVRGIDCADLRATGSGPSWGPDARSIQLANIVLGTEERARHPDLEARLVREVRLTPLLAPEGLREVVPIAAAALADPSVDVQARIASAKPSAAFTRGEELVTSVRLRGSVEIRPR